MEVVVAVVPLMVTPATELTVEMVVVDTKFLPRIKIQRQVMDLLDLVVHTSGLLAAAEVESMTQALVVRVKVVTVLT
tara:strand:- start:135 stop:365 length:231 start_codon:yes stop_codon:yes gene_type:complete